MRRAFIGLGSNMGSSFGEAGRTLELAAQHIGLFEGICSVRLSSLYESEPAYVENQPTFTNAVLEVRTTLSAPELLQKLFATENEFGRVRSIDKGPRTLDCDLLDYEGVVSDDLDLTLPHPGILERDFVVTPLLEIAPGHVLSNGIAVTRENIAYGTVSSCESSTLWE